MKPALLITNDDGIRSRGIQALFESLSDLGDLWLVAPDRERNACGRSLTLRRPLRIDEVRERQYAVDGTPVDCVNLALSSIMDRKPDLIVSGINMGANLGDDITYSGTVGAAIEGTFLGIPSMAVSLELGAREDPPFAEAAQVAAKVARLVLARGVPEGRFLNVNMPLGLTAATPEVRITRQGRKRYTGGVDGRTDPRGRNYYWIGSNHYEVEEGDRTDYEAIERGEISVTPLKIDLTDDSLFLALDDWRNAIRDGE